MVHEPNPIDDLSRYLSMLAWRNIVMRVLEEPEVLPVGALPLQYRIELEVFLGVLNESIFEYRRDRRFFARTDGGMIIEYSNLP